MTQETLLLPPSKRIYFASDFHLSVPDHDTSLVREKKVVAWLDTIKHDAFAIYLLGDIFDFWFEYRTTIPKGFIRLQGKLAELRDAGIHIYFFTGNHDMWMFDYFPKELGIPIYRDPIILQVGAHAMEQCGGDPLYVMKRLSLYGDSLDYILFDKSMGQGKGMNAEILSTFVGTLEADRPDLMSAVGGGLGPTTMHLVRPLARAYPCLSWDAQARIRPGGTMMTPIDMGYASAYVRGSISLIDCINSRLS